MGTLQLEVAIDSGSVLYPWGYHPRASRRSGRVPNPLARGAGLTLVPRHQLRPGVSLDVTGGARWATVYDDDSGWIGIHALDAAEPQDLVLFAAGAVAGLRGGQLVGLWLHPQEETP